MTTLIRRIDRYVAPYPVCSAWPSFRHGRLRLRRGESDASTAPAMRVAARPTPAADPKANAERGRALAFDQARWDEALPVLAAGDDPALHQLAAADLKVGRLL
jgi:hypothetical protein